ncbi:MULTISPECIES: helix-turn-helix domain-containing protein [Culturomica]|jgi:HTH-type transcriptional regulator/antitoxin HipB|uniref:helix-turn-helix domain-containing protein n=1 Tax=Culturomica TaxID=1926651 RepID=UPI000837C50D|nr:MULTISPECIES: helix-turn-helix transcriptional regulator [Culturomica]HBO27043.1 XRE family transcriptional regulator [Culturomica sp.]
MEEKKFYTQEEVKDMLIGKKGTPERDNYESELNLFLIGEAIKRTRLDKNMTQEDLGKLIGVQKAQISRIENGKNLTLATVIKIFKALGVNARLEIEDNGYKVALC